MVLVVLILLPAVIYLIFETARLNESEEMIREVYRQQLDAVLFSVNQYIEDYTGSWRNRVNISLGVGETDLYWILSGLNGVQALVIWDMDMHIIEEASVSGDMSRIHKGVTDSLQQIKIKIRQLISYQKAGYQKIQPLLINRNDSGELLLLFIINEYLGRPVVAGLVIPIRSFIENVIGTKLNELAGDRFNLGVFYLPTRQPVLAGQQLQYEQARQTKGIWLLPDYLIGIKLAASDIEDLARERFYRDITIIGMLFFLFLLGAWLIFRNVRREILLAQMKSDFVSNVSHELRTPLSLIRMYTETLELGRVTSEEKRMHYYTIISQETDRLTRLINNILNFSRIESGKKTYKPENIDLNRLVEQVIDTYRGQIEREQFQVNIDLADHLEMIYADPGAVTEALINLLDNAIKYSAERKEISIHTYECTNGICLEISDRGIGIGEEHLKHIFDKFYRVPTGAVHNTKGSGLGLSLVRHIIEAHGGTINVTSQPGQGSTFSLVLPKSKKTV